MTIALNKKTMLNTAFILFFISTFLFTYSAVSRIMLVLFCVAVIFTLRKIRFNSYLIFYALFTAWSFLIIQKGYAIDVSAATDMSQTLVLNCIFLFFFTQYCDTVDNPLTILQIYRRIAIILTLLFVPLSFFSSGTGERLTVFGLNENSIGMFAAYAAVIQIYLAYEKKASKYFPGYSLFVIALLALCVLLTGSRKSLLIIIIGWYVVLCCRKPKKFVLYSLLGIGFATLLIQLLLNVGFLYDLIGYRIEPLIQYFQGTKYEEGSLVSRVNFIELAWEESKNSPIWGHGLDCFRLLPGAFGTYSHSNYLELLFSTGWVGIVIFYFVPFLTILKLPIILKRKDPLVPIMLAILIPYLICDYMNVTYYARDMLILPALTTIYLGKVTKNEHSKSYEKSISTL